MYGPNPNSIYPNERIKQVYFIMNVIKNLRIIVGDYTYYDTEAALRLRTSKYSVITP